jgi:enoyl-CoA hydratase/carnithine racemase
LSAVRIERDGAVAVITVDNPPVNALGNAVLDALAGAAEQLGADDGVRAVVLTGAGVKAFMAGADLDEFRRLLDGDGSIAEHVGYSSRALGALASLPQPLVAAVQAAAMGGGLEVALTADLIVADPGAVLGLPEVRLGLMPGAGGTQRLPRRIGAGRAKELMLLGGAVQAEEAKAMGLVNRVSAPGAALEEARELAGRLAALSPLAVRSIKRAVTDGLEGTLEEGLHAERELFMGVFNGPDAREGVAAFVEKRRARFG